MKISFLSVLMGTGDKEINHIDKNKIKSQKNVTCIAARANHLGAPDIYLLETSRMTSPGLQLGLC
jgi:hypothetical protein